MIRKDPLERGNESVIRFLVEMLEWILVECRDSRYLDVDANVVLECSVRTGVKLAQGDGLAGSSRTDNNVVSTTSHFRPDRTHLTDEQLGRERRVELVSLYDVAEWVLHGSHRGDTAVRTSALAASGERSQSLHIGRASAPAERRGSNAERSPPWQAVSCRRRAGTAAQRVAEEADAQRERDRQCRLSLPVMIPHRRRGRARDMLGHW